MKNRNATTRALMAGILFLGMAVSTAPALGDTVTFFSANFDAGAPAEFSGVTTTEGVQGWAGLGHGANVFGGLMLRNDTGPYAGGPALPTQLTLTGLPPHDHIDLHFLLAIIDTWDGDSGGCDPDYFNVTVDGQLVFSESFTNFPDTHTASYPDVSTPAGVILFQYSDLGFLDFEPDSAYDLGLEPALQGIPHTASTLTITWFASGDGWQGSYDESWAIDNVEIVNEIPGPPVGACCFASGACLIGDEGECTLAGGTYMGDGSICDPNPCGSVPVEDVTWGGIKSRYR